MEKAFTSVSMAEGLKMMSAEKDFILLDVRLPFEYAKGHIPGAVHLTNETMTLAKAEKLLKDKNTHIFVYCLTGHRSRAACKKLVNWGYTAITEIGGILDYSGEIEK